jgi:5-carboxyvanillate decarboxylase
LRQAVERLSHTLCRHDLDRAAGSRLVGAEEIRRECKDELGFKGVMVNSHTQGEYLDDPEVRSDLPRAASRLASRSTSTPRRHPIRMIDPMLESGLDGAIFGFGVETGMHLLRLMTIGSLRSLSRSFRSSVGHMVARRCPIWLYRLNFMHLRRACARTATSG